MDIFLLSSINVSVLAELISYAALFLTLYFEVFLVVTYIEHRGAFARSKTFPTKKSELPSVAVVVPAWNEEKTLAGTVNSLLALDYPKDMLSIFIVDDGSTDGTLKEAQKFAEHPQVRIHTKENGGKHTALNFAIARTDSELIGCLDADSFVSPSALREIVEVFRDSSVMAVTPSVQIGKPRNALERMQAIEYVLGAFTRKVFALIGGLYVTPGPFSIYRKSVFEQIGGFVDGFRTEDMEMAMRMQHHRMRIENAAYAHVYTVPPSTPIALYKQRVRWVTGFLKNALFNYRHMFLSSRHGNLGLLTLPFAFGSIFIALYFAGTYAMELGMRAYKHYLKFSAVGYDLRFGWPHFDWFSLNLEYHRLLIYALLIITVVFIALGLRMTKRASVISLDMLYFIFLYGLIAPWWLAKSVVNLVTAKEAPWR
jgi:poly-beta-1,6-N-acetyl-D-glucosamine synthase